MSNYNIIKICFLVVIGTLVACSPKKTESVQTSINSNSQPELVGQPTPYHAYIDPVTGQFISSPAKSTKRAITASSSDHD